MDIDFSKIAAGADADPGSDDANGNDDKIKSFDEAAQYCGVSKRTIHYHITRGTIRQFPDGTFDKDSLNEYLKSKREKQGVRAKGIKEKIDNADLRLKEHRIRKAKIEADILEGKYVSLEHVAGAWDARVKIVKSGLNSWINRLPPILAGKSRIEIRDILKSEIREILDAYSTNSKYTPAKN